MIDGYGNGSADGRDTAVRALMLGRPAGPDERVIRRAAFLRRLSRIEDVRIFQPSYEPPSIPRQRRRFAVMGAAGKSIEVPSGWLTGRQVSDILMTVGLTADDYDAVR